MANNTMAIVRFFMEQRVPIPPSTTSYFAIRQPTTFAWIAMPVARLGADRRLHKHKFI
jgi:hypothetical protein